jgi:deoxyribonuclease-4
LPTPDAAHEVSVKIGAHVSSSAPLAGCVDRACAIGAEAIQIFASAPQSWRPGTHTDAAIAAMAARASECSIAPVYLHGVYLINLASADEALVNRSVGSLKQYLQFCAATGAKGTIFHTGSHKGAGFESVVSQIAGAIERVLEATPEQTWLVLENSAGQGGTVGGSMKELGAIIRAVGSERVKICLDTCHAFAAGYDITSADGCDRLLHELDAHAGAERLVALHANDSKAGLGSGLDRHENIGEGAIGREGFRQFLGALGPRDLPLILEVPGYEKGGPDQRNVETLRAICDEAGVL